MTQAQHLSDSMENLIVSSKMEGIEITERLKVMYLSILNGETTLESCLLELNAKYHNSVTVSH